MIRQLMVTILGVVALLGATACGSGDDGDSAAAVTPAAPAAQVSTAATTATEAATAAPVATQAAVPPRPSLPVTVADKDGRQVTVTDVSRIIPLNGDIAEVVWALGLGGNVVATDTSATYPAEAAAAPKIGYQRALAAEGIIALRPTLVIGSETAGPPAVLEQLRGAGVPVLILSYPATLEGPLVKIRAVAAALGVKEAGEALAAKTKTEIDAGLALAAKATRSPRVAFLYLRGNTTQQIGGKGTGADTMIAAAHATDAGAEAGIEGFKPVTPEALVTARPDVLLLLSAGLESVGGVDGLMSVPGIAQTPAGRNRRVLALDDQFLLGMGPRAGQALMELVKGLHPDLR